MTRELYEEEFVRDLKTGESITKQINNIQEKAIIQKWVSRICKLSSPDIKVKKARNEFYKHLLGIMRISLQHEKELDSLLNKKPKLSFKSTWSPDRNTYVAVQPLPNRGALIYMACNARPDLGWDIIKKKR